MSSASGSRTTAASRACENSRPIAAPICATSFAGPSRSSRAISEACRLAGTASAGDGTAAAVRRASPSLSASKHRFGHFLHEQRNAVGALDDVLPSRQPEVACSRRGVSIMVADFALSKPVEREGRDMRLARSTARRTPVGKLRPAARGRASIRSTVRPSTSKARGIDPMRILEDHQHRVLACQSRQVVRLALPAFFCRRCCGGKVECGIASIVRKRQHLGKERWRPAWRSRSAPTAHRACRASLSQCRRAPIRRHVPSGR